VASDLLLVATLVLVGGTVVLATLPLAGVLVVVEVAARWPFRRATVATGLFALTWSAAILADWPSWAGWSSLEVGTALVTPLASLPIALALVARIAGDRDRSRAVATQRAERLRTAAEELQAAN